MKKILLMTFEYPVGKSYSGGVGQVVKQSRHVLLDLGYDVHVLIAKELHGRHPVKLLLPDNTLKSYSSFWAFQRKNNLFKYNYIIQHFVNWTKELKKIIKHNGKKPKILYHFHSILRREKDSGFRTLNRFLLNQEKMIRIADRVICPSRYEYDNFIRYFPLFRKKVILIENTVETFPLNIKKVRSITDKHGIKKRDIVSIYVGRLERIKGADIVIEQISDLLRKHRNLKFFMIGRVLEKDLYKKLTKLQKMFPRQLFYIRYLDKCDLFQYYYLSHIYVNSSLSESFSLSTHENALCNSALLLNDLPVFDKFKDAALVFSNHDNKNSFSSKFEYLIRHPALRKQLSKKASRIARNFLAHNKFKQDFAKFFKEN
ncbi:MAG: glycosyltransferase family 4 protein [Candidatus Omnitrophica bacterium]|nr:glycosyltransferase family 4 protein [Candidatus Omnitrophota bacterium]